MASYPQKILPFILHRRELIVVTVLVFRVVEQLDVIKYVSESPRFPRRSFGLGSLTGLTAVIVFLSFRWRNVADGLEQGVVIEPGDPLQRCQLHRLGAFPGATAMDQLRFVESVDRLGQGVVVRSSTTEKSYRIEAGSTSRSARAVAIRISARHSSMRQPTPHTSETGRLAS